MTGLRSFLADVADDVRDGLGWYATVIGAAVLLGLLLLATFPLGVWLASEAAGGAR